MNKIYKVIWSKVKHQYVVTSEFAHSCTKSTTSRVGKSAVAALAAFVLTAGVGGVQAAEYEVTVGSDTTPVSITEEELQKMLSDAGIPVGNVDGEYSIAIGEGSRVKDGSQSAMAIGYNAMAAKDNTLAVGTSAAAGSKGSIAIGSKAKASYGLNAMALGNEATAFGTQSVAIGYQSQVKIADHKKQSADNAIALGTGAKVNVAEKAKSADNAIALGKNATIEAVSDNATVNNAIAIGTNSYVKGGESIAIGNDAKALNSNVVAIGRESTAKGGHSVALGYQSQANAEASTALGYHAIANGENSIALGAFSQAGTNAVALGRGSVAEDDTVSVGNDTLKRRITNVADGTKETDAVNLKQLNTKTAGMVQWEPEFDEEGNPTGEYTNTIHGVTLENGNVVTAKGADLDDVYSRTQGIKGNAYMTNIQDTLFVNSVGVSIPGTNGNTAITMTKQGDITALGDVQANDFTTEDGLSLRALNTTVATNNEGVVRYTTDENGKYTDDVTIEGNMKAANVTTTEGADLNAINKRTANIQQLGETTIINNKLAVNEVGVSIPGTDGNTAVWMQTNGNVTATGTMQAYDFTTEDGLSLRDLNTTVSTNNEGVVRWDKTTNDKGETIYQEGQLTVDNLNTTTLRAGNGHFYVADDGSFAITNGDNLPTFSVGNDGSMNAAGGKFQVSNTGEVVAQDMYVGSKSETNAVVTKGELDSAVSDMTNNSVQWDDPQTKESINGVGLKDGKVTADTINVGDGALVVDKSGNTTVGGDLNVEGDLKVNGDYVATAGQINDIKTDVSGIKKQIGVAENQTVSDALTNKGETLVAGINQNTAAIGNVTALKGTNANGEKYTNLTDAVNGNYDRIEQNTTAIAQNSQAINSLGHRVSDLGDEIDSVGAISAALAGLHPLDYDGTGSKFQISAAMGTYDGTQAAAIGGFYHFNRDVMMSLGGATSFEGDKKTAANIGVTFRVGEGASGKTVSNDILARLEAMDQKIAALEQENKDLKNVLGAIDTSLSKEFPDVPANHWAYEAVTKLAGNDVVAGYPDGEFHGDRTMTRYEMAEIIYKAMNRGVQVDQKLVEEFKPEMEQVAANQNA